MRNTCRGDLRLMLKKKKRDLKGDKEGIERELKKVNFGKYLCGDGVYMEERISG